MKYILLVLLAVVLFSCKKTIIQETVYDNIIYNVDTVYVYSTNLDKTKQKSPLQYISILYADLFRKSISSNTLADLSEFTLSMGDKTVSNELIISSFIKANGVIMPTDAEMRANLDKFVEDTYRLFYLRKPTEYEKYYLMNMIGDDQGLTPELIYISFMLSDEYQFY